MTVSAEIATGARTLARFGIEGGARDARVLMAAALGVEVGRLTLHMQDIPTEQHISKFRDNIRRRIDGAPVSHIIGRRLFYGRDFIVTPDVLDPRGDTETLIEAALAVPFSKVLDLGTGSGCILVTLLAERAGATGMGADISPRALAVARRNAQAHAVDGRCRFEESNWFEAVGGTYDLIVSNPPYIALEEMAGLSAEVLQEPRMALTDGGDGLSCYRIITAGAPVHLAAGGWLMAEIGPTQGAAVAAMFCAAGLAKVAIHPDLDGRDRVVLGQKPL